MSQFRIRLQDFGRCEIVHRLAETVIISDLPPEFGGSGRCFSSTDLVCSALGSCMLTSIETVLRAEQIDPLLVTLNVEKELSSDPKMIKRIAIQISYPESCTDSVLGKLKQAVQTCTVRRSLHPEIEITTEFMTS